MPALTRKDWVDYMTPGRRKRFVNETTGTEVYVGAGPTMFLVAGYRKGQARPEWTALAVSLLRCRDHIRAMLAST